MTVRVAPVAIWVVMLSAVTGFVVAAPAQASAVAGEAAPSFASSDAVHFGVLASFAGWPDFREKAVTAKVPTTASYDPATKKTVITYTFSKTVTAKSVGSVVYVKFTKPTRWLKVPYRYVKATNSLRYEESIRLKLNIKRDPLGAVTPTSPGQSGSATSTVPALIPAVSQPSTGGSTPPPCDPTAQPCGPTVPQGPAPTVVTGSYDVDQNAVSAVGAGWAGEMLGAVNAERAANGVPALRMCQTLNDSAQGWANYLASTGRYAHNVGTSTGGLRIAMSGYNRDPGWGENLANDFNSVGEVMAGWKTSPGHYRNLIDRWHVDAGFGIAMRPDGEIVWVQNFGDGGTC
jgi:uncharacterized protein YkwD